MRKYLCFAMLSVLLAGSIGSASAKRATLDELMAKWHKTGKVEKCILISNISGTQVWDDQHILFKMNGGKAYLNTLPNVCHRLGYDESFAHTTWGGWICAPEMIYPLDPQGGIPGHGCNLGQFEQVEKVKPQK